MRTWPNEMITANGIEMKWPRGGLSRKGKLKKAATREVAMCGCHSDKFSICPAIPIDP